MAERKFGIRDVQPWYDRAAAGDIQDPYLFEAMGSDRDLKADYISERVLPLFVKDVYQRTKMVDEWKAAREKRLAAEKMTVKGVAPGATPEYSDNLPGTVGEANELLMQILATPTPTPRS